MRRVSLSRTTRGRASRRSGPNVSAALRPGPFYRVPPPEAVPRAEATKRSSCLVLTSRDTAEQSPRGLRVDGASPEEPDHSRRDRLRIGTRAATAVLIRRIHRPDCPEHRTGARCTVKQTSGNESRQGRLRGHHTRYERGARNSPAAER